MRNDRFLFRFWFPGIEMVIPGSEVLTQDGLTIEDVFENHDMIPMQFIGVTDTTGCRIFEGDIVDAPDVYGDGRWNEPGTDGRLRIVFDDESFFGFVGFDESGGAHLIGDWCFNGMSTLKVIGNIYENPELMD